MVNFRWIRQRLQFCKSDSNDHILTYWHVLNRVLWSVVSEKITTWKWFCNPWVFVITSFILYIYFSMYFVFQTYAIGITNAKYMTYHNSKFKNFDEFSTSRECLCYVCFEKWHRWMDGHYDFQNIAPILFSWLRSNTVFSVLQLTYKATSSSI